MKKNVLHILIFFLLIATFTSCEHKPKEVSYVNYETNVVRVIDGDTFVATVEGKEERIRLIGVDAPESVHPDERVNEPYGDVVSEITREMIEGKTVILELDVEKRDKYNRMLAYVYCGDLMINEYLLQKGHATVDTYPPNTRYLDVFEDAESKAKEHRVGIWGE